MLLSKVTIKNFRSIKETSFDIGKKVMAIVGSNESGKSNILRALELFYQSGKQCQEDDRYQLSSENPEITVSFKTALKNSDFNGIFDREEIKELTIQRKLNNYFLISPNLKEPPAVSEVTEEPQTETPAEQPAEPTPPPPAEQVPEVPIENNITLNDDGSLKPETVTLIMAKIPRFLYIPNLNEEFLHGKNISIEELTKNQAIETGQYRTIWDFLAIGGINDASQLTNTDLDQRLKFFHRASSRISQKINNTWNQEDVKIRITPAEGHLVIHFRDGKNCDEKDDTTWIWTCPEDRSFGFQWYIAFYSRFLGGTNGTMKNALILLDDPGVALNASAQRDLINLFASLSSDNQIIYTTHSPYMVDWERPKNVVLATKQRKDESEGTTINTNWKFRKISELPEPLKDIGFTCAGQVLNIRNLIVEGLSDKVAILGINNFFKFTEILTPIKLEQFRIVDAGSASETVGLSNYATKTEGLKTLILLDKDTEGEKAKQRCDRAGLSYCFVTDVAGTNTKKETIEDFVPFDKYLSAVNETHKDVYEDWQDLTHADFPHTHTPAVKNIEKVITQKVPSSQESEEPLIKLLAMEKLFENLSLEDFLKADNSLNDLGQLWQELFKKINQSLK